MDISTKDEGLLNVVRSGGCQCDPPGAGQEFCTGHCYLRAEVEQWQHDWLNVQIESERTGIDMRAWKQRAETVEVEVERLKQAVTEIGVAHQRLRAALAEIEQRYGASMSLTAAQVWYVARVYPERVTDAEAREAYEKECETDSDRSYWEAAAKVLSEIGGKSPVIEAAEDEVERQQHSIEQHCPGQRRTQRRG